MLHRKKTNVFLLALALVSFGLINCAEELPLEKLALAKTQVERAESLAAEEFAPEEFADAKKSLVEANNFASESKASESRKSADYAISKAYDALEKTLPKLTAGTREDAVLTLDRATEANAGEYAAEDFKKATDAREAGDSKLALADASLAEYLREDKDENAKALKRTLALQEYEDAYNHYREASSFGGTALSASTERAAALRSEADEVEAVLAKASAYSNGTNTAVEDERAKIQSAKEDIDAGKLKSAEEKIKSAREASVALLATVVREHAGNRNGQAKDVVEDANARFGELNKETYLKSDKKESYVSAEENIGASNESLQSSSALLEQEKFEDSIAQSEEAIRLAEISIDQVEALKGKSTTVANNAKDRSAVGEDGMEATTEEQTTSSQIEELSNGWKRYTVEKSNPADCLWRIAEREEVYSDAKLWPRIFEANRKTIKNKNLIYPKQKLNIPPKTGKIGKAPKK
ncbi:lipoprotein LipL71 [Leptospira sp. 96542]|nr:lipoprotein LipL71 [Leptospira sp. 96542]